MKALLRGLAVLFSLGLALTGVGVSAEHETDPYVGNIVTTFPMDYASCVDAVTSDTISFENVGDRYLRGQITVQYVTDAGREIVPGGVYMVDHVGDLTLEVEYPPVSQWPVQSNGTAEIHVDVSVEVYTGVDGDFLGVIGPRHDWDIFCLNPPTPPTEPPPPTGLEGCTPGFWKVRPHRSAWDLAGYTTDQTVESVFDVPDAYGLDNDTLLDALSYHGGPTTADAARILLRASVAAVLDAGHPDIAYPLSEAEIVSQVNDALASGDRDTILDLKDDLDGFNKLNCTIDG